MKIKTINTGSDSRTKLLSGVKQLAEAVVTTLGPNGRNVVIAQEGGAGPQSTKDGVTVMVPKFGAQVVVVENETYIIAGESDVLGIIKQKEDNE